MDHNTNNTINMKLLFQNNIVPKQNTSVPKQNEQKI